MHRSTADTISFFTTGLVHQFGNLLLTIQGNALAFGGDAASAERAREAILSASDRGALVLRLLRHLLGDPAAVTVDAHMLGEQLVELARVPVREARQVLVWVPQKNATQSCPVDMGEFVPLVGEALRSLVHEVPTGVQGTVTVAVAPALRDVHVLLRFEPVAGSLPFPLALDRLAGNVAATARQHGWHGTCRQLGRSLECVLPRLDRAVAEPSDGLHGSFSMPT
ncbi:MAG: hypothetical protein JNL12_04550 [Planctomycetes bacterium]|nr:hypothetical protein [Planctomycetota bacterium]